MSTYVRGVLTTVSGAPVGYIQSISATKNAEIHQVRDSTGITRVHDAYDLNEEVRVTVKLSANNTVGIGDELTVAACRDTEFNGTYKVQPGSTFGEENQDSPTVELILLRFSDGDVPAQDS